MTTSHWLTISAIFITVVGSVMSYLADISYVPSILMFFAAMLVIGAGMNIEETATALAISPATVKRDWVLARAWLIREAEWDDSA